VKKLLTIYGMKLKLYMKLKPSKLIERIQKLGSSKDFMQIMDLLVINH